MDPRKSCFQWHVIFMLLLFTTDGVLCGNSTEDTTDNFFTSNQFIGISAGLGTFLLIGIYLYTLWKCTCGSPDDDTDDKRNKIDDIKSRQQAN